MSLISTKYYYENTATIILTSEGKAVIKNILLKHEFKCPICNNRLILNSLQEGDFISCPKDVYHKNNLSVKHASNYINEPAILISVT